MLFNTNGTFDNSFDGVDLEPSKESASAIMEVVLREGLSENELQEFLENQHEIDTALGEEILTEKTIVRLDKYAKLNQAQKIAVFTIAREKKDVKFKKLLTVWAMERRLENELFKKYGNEALRVAKKQVAKAGKSKSSKIKKAANKLKAQFNSAR